MQHNTYLYSQLSSHSVQQHIALHYDLADCKNCKFYMLGLHDNYYVELENGKYILRIYRNDWRTQEQVNFELDLLDHLGKSNAAVATPVRTNAATLTFTINSPEGQRAAALFHYADGHAPGNAITVTQSTQLGNSVATIHLLAETFSSPYKRPILDIAYLLDESLITIEPFITTELRAYLKLLQNKLHLALVSLQQKPPIYGICIGDVNPTNFHINNQAQLTLFDFDQCGYGYRAFEIGKFISSIHSIKNKQQIAKAFLNGYQQQQPLSPAELNAIPYFEIISVIWVMAIHAHNVDRIGHRWLDCQFWDQRFTILKELDSLLPSKVNDPN